MATGNLFFRFKEFHTKDAQGSPADQVLITNDFGKFQFLDNESFQRLNEQGKTRPEILERLTKDLFFLGERASDVNRAAELFHQRNAFLRHGPSHHAVHVSALHGAKPTTLEDGTVPGLLTVATAKKLLNFVFQTSSPRVVLDIAGSDPLDAWPAVEFLLEYAQELAAQKRKNLEIRFISHLSGLTTAQAQSLQLAGAKISPLVTAGLLNGGSAEGKGTLAALEMLGKPEFAGLTGIAFVKSGDTPFPDPASVVAFLRRHNLPGIDAGLLDARSFSHDEWNPREHSAGFTAFYLTLFEELLKAGREGAGVFEENLRQMLLKVFSTGDPFYPELRSPHGAGLGTLSYSHDGNIYASDTGQLVYEHLEDDLFLLGNVAKTSFSDVMESELVRSLAVASCLESQPECSQCAFNPYCGVCPVYNYLEQGDIFGQTPTNRRCNRMTAAFDAIFRRILRNDADEMRVLQSWGGSAGN